MAKTEEYTYRGFPCKPRAVDRNTWFYEEPKGILLVRQVQGPDGALVKADMFTVPWRFILAAAKTPAAARRRVTQRKRKRRA